MPIYNFACNDCGNRFEQLCNMIGQDGVKCPACGSGNVNKLVSIPGLIRTEGRHLSGQTCCGSSVRCDRPPCSSGGQCHR